MSKEEIIKSWIESSDRNFISMEVNYNSKQYDWSLFIGHLVIEKLLKAIFVKLNSINPPPIHNLQRLAELANLKLTDEQFSWLADITSFNIQTRYEEKKIDFYKKCTQEFTLKYTEIIKELRDWLKQELMK
ncbi:MAG: HEPN domain-containing protein [Ignavibacteriales bacterium]|nr:HEPN domain-containing protein [Ignavibacteriales bacterium]